MTVDAVQRLEAEYNAEVRILLPSAQAVSSLVVIAWLFVEGGVRLESLEGAPLLLQSISATTSATATSANNNNLNNNNLNNDNNNAWSADVWSPIMQMHLAQRANSPVARTRVLEAVHVVDRIDTVLHVEALFTLTVTPTLGSLPVRSEEEGARRARTDSPALQQSWAQNGKDVLAFLFQLLASTITTTTTTTTTTPLDLTAPPRMEVVAALAAATCSITPILALTNASPTDAVCFLLPVRQPTNRSFASSDCADYACSNSSLLDEEAAEEETEEADDAACVPGFYFVPFLLLDTDSQNTTNNNSNNNGGLAAHCAPCPPNTFRSTSTTGCAPCPPGFTTHGFAGQACCAPCPPGTSTQLQPGVCAPCPVRQVAEQEGAPRCGCAAGTMPDYLQEGCVPCFRGSFQPIAGGAAPCRACPIRTIGSVASGATACDLCTAGAYTLTGGGGCLDCSPGTYQPAEGTTACVTCPTGTFAAESGAQACAPCPSGTHQPEAGGSVCLTCAASEPPSKRWRTSDLTRTACVCAPGLALDYLGEVCTPCLPGFYKPLADSLHDLMLQQCIMCPTYTTSLLPGASVCTDCAPGTARVETAYLIVDDADNNNNNHSACVPCPRGTFQPEVNSAICSPCAAGTFASDIGWSACALCPAGTFGTEEGMEACLTCAANDPPTKRGRTSDATRTACVCMPGFTLDYLGEVCTPCRSGFYKPLADSLHDLMPQQCMECPLYTTSFLPGASLCAECARGTARIEAYTTNESSLSGPGGGHAACAPCPHGTFQPEVDIKDWTTACVPCPPGTFAAEVGGSAQACAPCPSGTHQPEAGGSVCLTCAASEPPSKRWRTSDLTRTACVCAPGFALDYLGEVCTPCLPGFYKPLADSLHDLMLQQCIMCPTYTTSLLPGASVCTDCAPGTARVETAYLIEDNAYTNQNYSACVPCPRGTFQPEVNSAICSPCAAGTFASDIGWSACALCPAGTFGTEEGMEACQPCQPFSNTLDVGRTACGCAPGFTIDYWGEVCTSCLPGFYKPLADSWGSGDPSQASSTTRCIACPPYTTSLVRGASVCTDCAPGTVRVETAYLIVDDADDNNNNHSACVPCPRGTFQSEVNSAICSPCTAGTFASDIGWSACALCPAGTFGTVEGAEACQPCQPFSNSLEVGRTAPCDCGSGWGFVPETGLCTACPGGATNTANGRCVACPAGSFAGDIGEGLECIACPPGSFAAISGWTACLPCPLYTTSARRARFCTCAPGTRTDYATLTCQPCPAGSYYNSSVECQPCLPGSYSQALMATACAACPPGTASPFFGSTACQDCAQMVTAERSACHCPIGTFNATTTHLENHNSSSSSNAWRCEPCIEDCGSGRFIAAPCAHDHDIQCANCTRAEEVPCPVGTFQRTNCTATSDRLCWPCRSGCLQGHYVTHPCGPLRDTHCIRCNLHCPGGNYLSTGCAFDADTLCLPCRAGTFSIGGEATACTTCAPGSVVAAANSTACIPCASYSNPAQTACVNACPPGAYPASPKSCATCPAGTFSVDGTLCLACAGGCVSENGAACLDPCPSAPPPLLWLGHDGEGHCLLLEPGALL